MCVDAGVSPFQNSNEKEKLKEIKQIYIQSLRVDKHATILTLKIVKNEF